MSKIFLFIFIFSASFFCSCIKHSAESKSKINSSLDSCLMKWREDSLGCKGYRELYLDTISPLISKFKSLKEITGILGKPNLTMEPEANDSCWNLIYYYQVRCENDSVVAQGCSLNVVIVDGKTFSAMGMIECE